MVVIIVFEPLYVSNGQMSRAEWLCWCWHSFYSSTHRTEQPIKLFFRGGHSKYYMLSQI